MVQVVGIWGTRGSEKTTLAKEIYNRISPLMESSRFIFDVHDASFKGMLRNKQINLLKDLGVEGVAIKNIEDGKTQLAEHFRSVRVLIILDDVDHADQLDTHAKPVPLDGFEELVKKFVTSNSDGIGCRALWDLP
ncbi:hypothetical protein SUGI_0909230 [Cryptomeria japonica]|nr:hypothetical protein SUGI_0909230 [Cryptomeria japonica]